MNIVPIFGLVAACDLPPGGGDDDGQNLAESTTCELNATALDSIDAVSPVVGISGSDVLATLSSPYDIPASYPAESPADQIPAPGSETGLTLTVAYAGGPIVENEAVLVEGTDEMWVECDSFVAIEVQVGFATADGAFAETWTGALIGYAPEADLPLDLAAFGVGTGGFAGSFQPGTIESEYALTAGDIVLQTNLDPAGPTGELAQTFTFESGDVAGATFYRLLAWGGGA
jgi:hypothetical protein